MLGFKDHLKENSFYTTPAEKDAFVKDDKSIMDAFFYGFIGWVALLGSATDKTKVKNYFRSDQKLRLTTIDDTNNDASLIIKIMADNGFFKTSVTPNEITRFLVKAKAGQVDDVDEAIVRKWIGEVNPSKLNLTSAAIKRANKTFMDGGTLGEFAEKIRKNAKVTKWKESEIALRTKGIRIDKNKSVKGIAPDSPATTPDPISAQPAAPTAATAPAVTVTKNKKKDDATANDMVNAFFHDMKSADEFDKEFKTNADTRDYAIQRVVANIMEEGWLEKYTKQFNEFCDYVAKWSLPESYNRIINRIRSAEKRLYLMDKTDYLKHLNAKGKVRRNNYSVGNALKVVELKFQEVFDKKNTFLLSGADEKELVDWYNNVYYILVKKNDWGSYRRWNVESLPIMAILEPDFFKRQYVNKQFKTDGEVLRYDELIKDSQNWAEFFNKYNITVASKIDKVLNAMARSSTFGDAPWKWNNANAIADSGFTEKQLIDAYRKLDTKKKEEIVSSPLSRFGSSNTMHNDLSPFVSKLVDIFLNEIVNNYTPDEIIRMAYSRFGSGSLLPNIKAKYTVKSQIIFNIVAKAVEDHPEFGINEIRQTFGVIEDINAISKRLKDALTDKLNSDIKLIGELSDANYGSDKAIWEKVRDWVKDETIENLSNEAMDTFFELRDKVDEPGAEYMYTERRMMDNRRRRLLSLVGTYGDMPEKLRKRLDDEVEKRGGGMPNWVDDFVDDTWFEDKDYSYFKKASLDDTSLMLKMTGLTQFNMKKRIELFDKVVGKSDESREEFLSDLSTLIDRRLSDPANTLPRSDNMFDLLAHSEEIPVSIFKKFADEEVRRIGTSWKNSTGRTESEEFYNVPRKIASVIRDDDETLNTKQEYFFSKVCKRIDEASGDRTRVSSYSKPYSKLTREYQEFMTVAQPQFMKFVESNRKAAEDFYMSTSKSMKRKFAAAYLIRGDFTLTALDDLYSPDVPIKPLMKLDKKRVKEILKYNNVTSEESKLPDRHIRDFMAMDNYSRSAHSKKKKLEDLKIEDVEMDSRDLGRLTAELHRTKRSGRHGDISMEIKRVFNVAIPVQATEQAAWIKSHPRTEIINPMYHGTGSVAASMILRYGWAVIKSGDASVVGRMLGDGIYGSNKLDKAQQYVSDTGYGRRPGTRGYIFVINAALGEEYKDYRVMGLGRDHIRSPEWCVYVPNSQFKIVQAYEVTLIDRRQVETFLAKYPASQNEDIRIRFKHFLNEVAMAEDDIPEYTSYTFINGNIPTEDGQYVDFEDFKPSNDKVTLEPSAYGPTVVVRGTETSDAHLFTSPTDMQINYPELYDQYMKQIKSV
jgi:hypothetical protein